MIVQINGFDLDEQCWLNYLCIFALLQIISVLLVLPPLVELGKDIYDDVAKGEKAYPVDYLTPPVRALAMVLEFVSPAI